MIKVQALIAIVSLALCIYCVIEAIVTDSALVRNMPKALWILLILFFPLVGSIAWLVAGRPGATPAQPTASTFPEYDRPGRATGVTPESDEEFLRRTRERAEEQRRAYQEKQQREAQADERNQTEGDAEAGK